MSETRKLAAILVADVVGYSLLAGADEERTLARLRALRSDLIDPTIALHHGRIVKRTGDGSIIEFSQRGGCRPLRDRSAERNGRAQRRPAAGKAASSSASASIWATWSKRATAILWATGSISPRAWRASLSPERSASPRTPIAR